MKKKIKVKKPKAVIPFDPIEDALTNPIEELPRERDKDGNIIKVGSEVVGAELTLRQKRFCQLYATNKHFFGNGTQTYIEVYDIDQSKPGWYKTVRTLASRLLTNVNVMAYINSLLTADDFNDMAADRSLSFCMNQFSDLGVKRASTKDYNELKGRISDKVNPNINIILDPGTLFNMAMEKRKKEKEERMKLISVTQSVGQDQ